MPSRMFLALLVLRLPRPVCADGGEDHGRVVTLVDGNVLPHEAGQPVVVEDVGGTAVRFGGVDANGFEGLADDGGPVGAVLGEGLAGPLPGD